MLTCACASKQFHWKLPVSMHACMHALSMHGLRPSPAQAYAGLVSVKCAVGVGLLLMTDKQHTVLSNSSSVDSSHE